MPDILTDVTAKYLTSMEPSADTLVEEMESHAAADNIPIASRSVAGLQAILARGTDADRALEFGTAIGYSTLHVARTGTDVVTTEIDSDRIDAAVDYLERDGIDVTVTDDPTTIDTEPTGDGAVFIVEGAALETLPQIDGSFDLVFLDAIKSEYDEYLSGSLPLLRTGGLVVADNLLRGGRVAAAETETTPAPSDSEYGSSVTAIQAFNETFVDHDDLAAIISPQGDGTGIAVKTS
ncbi:O-methyltransferase mdmC [Natrialba chahannaoensis JCM 10990]|uniref:O-methyltransferase mdmC n=1 Tax=Natrialba chahannaoensis JCM 10990 TaxID=1227492 RepID=M0AAG0_9EURY|nr:O-methyltransferase [Natrialba chahannaoensis]ELY94328.1 O-methyltransferase mdmC [Natrialba chahannaoensis JCM 10990]